MNQLNPHTLARVLILVLPTLHQLYPIPQHSVLNVVLPLVLYALDLILDRTLPGARAKKGKDKTKPKG